MYHCCLHFYFTGRPCRVFEIVREMLPLERFTHEFLESDMPEEKLAAGADVIFANLMGTEGKEVLHTLTGANKKAQIILLADAVQELFAPQPIGGMPSGQGDIWAPPAQVKDIWRLPMEDAEIRFRFLRWQQACKESKDYWQTSQYLETTINSIPDLIWYKDKEGIHTKVNDSFCRTVNKTKEQAEGRDHYYIWDVTPEEAGDDCMQSDREVMRKRQVCVSEEKVKTGEGERLLTTYKAPLYDLDGSVMGVVGMGIDVTMERAYQEEVEKKNHILETIFTAIDCGVLCHTVDGKIISVNKAALKILGYETQEELEAGFSMIAASVIEEDRPKLLECIHTLENEGDSNSIEYRVLHENGELIHVTGNVKLLQENGEVFYQRFLVDCTAQKRQEREKERQQMELLEAALLQANKANKAKSEFLSNMSHDIRTPMNAIVGITTLAMNHIDEKERVKEYLGKIMASGEHMLNLINDVLDMSRIESGRLKLEEAPCSLTDLAGELADMIQADADAKGLKLGIEIIGVEDREVYCDKLRLNQVLLNILGNAVKYTDKGGSVNLSLTQKGRASAGYADYEFCVRDTGIGMSEEFLPRIFRPFEREKNTTISGIQGTGLGMAITKNLVSMMNGMIEVKSRQGEGTAVTVLFTFRLDSEAEAGGGRKEKTDSLAEKRRLRRGRYTGRILLAEDNALNREIAATILEDAGFQTETAENGKIAADMVRVSPPGYYRLVLMDIQMPVMDGYEATREIRALADKELAAIPILALTANAFQEDKQEALRCGMNGHIAKPIHVESLFDTLDQTLGIS